MSAPSVSGRWMYGLAKVLSTIDADVLAMRDRAHALDVGDVEHRVGRRLDEQVLGVRLDRRLDQLGLRGVDIGEVEAELAAHLLEQPERAAVGVVADQHVIAGLEPRQQRVDRRHARRKRKRRGARFDRRDVALERHARRVLRAAVFEAGMRLAEAVLHVGRGLIDRRDDRARRGIGLLSGVNANRAEARVVFEFHRDR